MKEVLDVKNTKNKIEKQSVKIELENKEDVLKIGQKILINNTERIILDIKDNEFLVEIEILNNKGIKQLKKQWYHISFLK